MVTAYFIINSFLAGAWWQNNDDSPFWVVLLETLCILLLGIPVILGLFVWVLIKISHLKTWYNIFFTKKFSGISQEHLERLKTSLGSHGWVWDKQIKVILKRNNYE